MRFDKWEDPNGAIIATASGGNIKYQSAIIQIVQGTDSVGYYTTTGSSYIQTGLTTTIIPKYSDSKFLVTGHSLINNRNAGQGCIATPHIKNLTTSSSWVRILNADSSIGGFSNADADQWATASWSILTDFSEVGYVAGQQIQVAMWIKGDGIGGSGSTTARFNHAGRLATIQVWEIAQ